MAENEETKQSLKSDDEKTNASPNDGKVTAKKVTKKRAAKKKVVKKKAVTKRVATKKTAVKAASASKREVAQESGQGVAGTNIKEEESVAVDAVIAGEPSDAGKSEIKDRTPVETGPSELPREEKVTMSAEASNTAKPSVSGGFGIKVIIWIIVVLAAFMYIRSLAHKGQTVKRSENPVPAAVSQTAGEAKSSSIKQNKPAAGSAVTDKLSKSSSSAVAKVGEVSVEKETLSAISSVANQASAVPVVDTAVSGAAQQEVKERESAVQNEVSSPIPVSVSKASIASTDEGSGPVPSSGSAATTSDQVTDTAVSGVSDTQTDAKAETSDVAAVSEQKVSPSATAVETRLLPEAARWRSTEESASTTVSEKPAAAIDTLQSVETSEVAGSADTATAAAAVPREMQGRDFDARNRRPSFKELFGYERPQPPVRRQDYATQSPYSSDSFEPQGYNPAPWPYAPMQPAWGGGYPGQYVPYGNYGGYPSYPTMPDWAPYQPYGYGPSGY